MISFIMMLLLNFSNSYAMMVTMYFPLIAKIMILSIFVILFIYVVSGIIYLFKSKRSKIAKINILVLWLIPVAIICYVLWVLACRQVSWF